MQRATSRQAGWSRAFLQLLCCVFVLRCATFAQAEEGPDHLVLVSPHWEGVQYEFERGFKLWYREHYGKEIELRWRDLGGTSAIEKALDATYKATPESCGVDLFFGGGMDPYDNLKRKHLLVPHRLPDELLQEVPMKVGGVDLIDPDFMYFGAALSSFGILENRRVTQQLALPEVTTWEDLCQPGLYGWVSSAEPRRSGSVHMIYEIILQAYGWEKGWQVIVLSSGNVKAFLQSSSAPTREVGVGDAAYAVSLDVNGLIQQNFLGVENVRFLIPSGVTVINPDGLGILKGAPNETQARRFVEYVMSRAGQMLFMRARGEPGGPVKFDISRMGVIPALYDAHVTGLLVPLNPFAQKVGFEYDSKKGGQRWSVVNDLMGQTIIDVHPYLRRAWHAVIQLPLEKQGRWREALSKPFISEAEAADCAQFWKKDQIRAGQMRNEWMRRAVQRYEEIRAGAEAELSR